jgi:hypothetical protein
MVGKSAFGRCVFYIRSLRVCRKLTYADLSWPAIYWGEHIKLKMLSYHAKQYTAKLH